METLVIDKNSTLTPDWARLIVLRSALGLEIKGMRRHGRSAYAIIKQEFGLIGSKQRVWNQFDQLIKDGQTGRYKPPLTDEEFKEKDKLFQGFIKSGKVKIVMKPMKKAGKPQESVEISGSMMSNKKFMRWAQLEAQHEEHLKYSKSILAIR